MDIHVSMACALLDMNTASFWTQPICAAIPNPTTDLESKPKEDVPTVTNNFPKTPHHHWISNDTSTQESNCYYCHASFIDSARNCHLPCVYLKQKSKYNKRSPVPSAASILSPLFSNQINTGFYINIDACHSIFPALGTERCHQQDIGKSYSWTFILPDITMSLLGSDFLANHRLLVDMAYNCLVSTEVPSYAPLHPTARHPSAKALQGKTLAVPTIFFTPGVEPN
ncbi:hypothetical protein SK128_022996 [Halocaridina rubra]|uniref:Uncharacterized protein n=1 Tax=Halocaridina rubra TaxID=373956 RepID=A0AAN8ZUQ7_HALRR